MGRYSASLQRSTGNVVCFYVFMSMSVSDTSSKIATPLRFSDKEWRKDRMMLETAVSRKHDDKHDGQTEAIIQQQQQSTAPHAQAPCPPPPASTMVTPTPKKPNYHPRSKAHVELTSINSLCLIEIRRRHFKGCRQVACSADNTFL